MRVLRYFLVSLLFLFSLFSVSPVHASDIDVTQVPQRTGELFGIPEPNTALIGGLIISIVVFMAIVLPSLLFKNKGMSLIFAFMALSLLVALSWIPAWIMLMILLLIAGMFARNIRKWFG